MNSDAESISVLCPGELSLSARCNLQSLEKGASTEELLTSDQPVGMSAGTVLIVN